MLSVRFTLALTFTFFCLFGIVSTHSQETDTDESKEISYTSPLFDSEVINAGEFDETDRTIVSRISDLLVQVAIHLEGAPLDQTKAMALAWAGAGEDKLGVIKADFYLRLGSFPSSDPLFFAAPSNELAEKAAAGVLLDSEDLIQSASSSSAELYAAYCLDLLRNIDSSIVQIEVSDAGSNADLDWSIFIPADDSGAEPALKMSSSIQSSPADGNSKFRSRQSLIKGLMVMDLGASEVAGQASQMNATIRDSRRASTPTAFEFNQEVGNSMLSALNEVVKYISVLHDGVPTGKVIEIAFEEQYSNKDGPSAAVACSLLINSLITGVAIDSGFAVTGDMNADGAVQPVGGISGKVRGASNRSCTHIAIPKKNVEILGDWVVMGEMKPFIDIQVFSIANFDEALALSVSPENRNEALSEAMTIFAEIQAVLKRSGGMKLLNNSHVQARLQRVVALAPNHESAKQLLLGSSGQVPQTLSLRGSFNQIDRVTRPIMEIFESGDISNSAAGLTKSVFALRRVRSKLDPRARAASDALEDLSETLKTIDEDNLAITSPRYRQLLAIFKEDLGTLKRAYNSLASDPEIQEELID